MKLSIITINRNNAAGLQKTMQSVAEQTFADFEYLVIDGASSDGSVAVIKTFVDSVSYWISEPDSGIYNAMNKGIVRAKGEYLLFLNSGDYLADRLVLDNVFSLVFDEDIVYGEQLKEEKGQLEKCSFLSPEDISFRSFLNSTLPHQCSFIKKKLFETIGSYNEKNRIVSDWEFNLLALFKYNCSLKKIEMPISVYDTTGISSDITIIRAHLLEKRQAAERHFPRVMKDVDAMEQFEKSKAYRLIKRIKKIIR